VFFEHDQPIAREVDCVYERCCEIASVEARPLPNQAAFEEWKKQTSTPLSF
jgi:hypothetical protein